MRGNFGALCAVALALLCANISADTVIFNTGEVMEGKVLKDNDCGILLEVSCGSDGPSGKVFIPKKKILRVEMDTLEKVAEREKKEAEAKELAERMRAQGLILYKGKWVTEDEKAAAEAKIAEAKKKREEARAAAAAQKAAEEAEAAQAAAAQKQQQAQKKNNSNPNIQSALNSMMHQGNTNGVKSLLGQPNSTAPNGY
jgi:Na+-translocating ferredoxin:NAD+ oxidoreductase RnfC subunit